MRVTVAHLSADLRMLSRMPGYTVPTLILPGLFLLMFGARWRGAGGGGGGTLVTASFATFAVFGVVFYKFGVSTAVERGGRWARYVRTLPLPPAAILAARLLSAAVFAVAAASLVLLTALTALGVHFTAPQVLRMYAALLGGAVPFTLLGIAVGYRTGPRSSVAAANLIYLLLSYGGGLWVPPQAMSPTMRAIAPLLPTSPWREVVWSSALELPWRAKDWLTLVFWTAAFGAAALHGYLRDEGARSG